MNKILYVTALLLALSLPATTQIPTSGLVSFWPFSGNANDAGPGSNDGTVNGATLVADRYGRPGSAYYFDGNDNITVPHHSSLDMDGALTISFWVKPDELQTSGNRMILGKSNYINKTNFLVRARPNGYFQWEYNGYTENNNTAITTTAWYHVTVTAAGPGTGKKIYINGVPDIEDESSSGPYGQITNPLTFGYASYGSEYFKGAIDDIRIYSRELSQAEVTALYTEGNCSTYNGIYGVKESDLTFLINDDFEEGVVGQLPEGWVIKHNGTATADQKVTDQVARNGTKSFETSGQSGWSATITKTPASMPSQVVFESWVRPELVLTGYSGRILLGDMSVGTWGTLCASVDFRNGRIEASCTGGSVYDIMPFTAGEWYHIKIIADNVSKTFMVHINGLPMSGTYSSTTTARFPMHATVKPRQAIVSAGNGGTVKMWFDDVKLYGIPDHQVCQTEVPFIFGTQSITEEGIYSELFTSVRGCDSTLTVNIKISTMPDNTVTDNNPVFTANESNATYQWINCNTGMALEGETGQSFTATSNGSYAVVVTRGACADTSACYSVTTLDLHNETAGDELRVYPNPTTGQVTIPGIDDMAGSVTIDVFNASGTHVASRTVVSGRVTIDISKHPAGVYFLRVTQGDVMRKVRVVKKG